MKPKFGTLEWSMKNNGVLTANRETSLCAIWLSWPADEASDLLEISSVDFSPFNEYSDLASARYSNGERKQKISRGYPYERPLVSWLRTYLLGAILDSYHKLE